MHKKAEILTSKGDQSLVGGEPLVLPEEVGLLSSEYEKLFGWTFGEGHDSKSWKRSSLWREEDQKTLRKEAAKRHGKSSSFFVFVDTTKVGRPMKRRIFIP